MKPPQMKSTSPLYMIRLDSDTPVAEPAMLPSWTHKLPKSCSYAAATEDAGATLRREGITGPRFKAEEEQFLLRSSINIC